MTMGLGYPRHRSGATLVEVLAACLIFSILLFSVYKIFFSSQKLSRKVVSELSINQDGVLLIRKIASEINEANFADGDSPPFLTATEAVGFTTADPRNTMVLVKQVVDFNRKPSQGFFKQERIEFSLEKVSPTVEKYKLKVVRKTIGYDKTLVEKEETSYWNNNIHKLIFFRQKNTHSGSSPKSIQFELQLQNEDDPKNITTSAWQSSSYIRGEKI